jgi:hypothetical protein
MTDNRLYSHQETGFPSLAAGRQGYEYQAQQQVQACHSNSLPKTISYTIMNKSANIPISDESIQRTTSENQLSQEEAKADSKDFLFFSRVVHGISSKQRDCRDGYMKYENQMCLDRIMRTRHADSHKPAKDDCADHFGQYGLTDQHGQDPAAAEQDPAEEDIGIFQMDL